MALEHRHRTNALRRGEQGYVLLTLLLVVTLMIIFAAAIVPSITFNIKRDREEEMIHRGVQYSRAIRAYYKKFGRYPMKLEDLENTNNLRFLRKRYKDPITGQEFKLLHYGEAQLALAGIAGGAIPGASPVGAGGLNGAGGLSQPSTFGGNAFGGNSTFGNGSGFGSTSVSSFGQNQPTQNSPGTDASQSSSTLSPPGLQPTLGANGTSSSSSFGQPGQPLGGGPIVGVASLSKKETIREFNHKKKYNEWQFIYDPGTDRGFLITTPYQPFAGAMGMQGMQNLNGQNGAGQNSFGPGNGSGTFGGSPSGLQNNPNPSPVGGYGTQNPPSGPPQQP